jgi:spermidine/putrescine transport system permease protein
MTKRLLPRLLFWIYLLAFFGFLLGPLLVMGVTAVNTPAYPQVYPFEGFTLHWFSALLGDQQLIDGMKTSLWIGLIVTLISVPTGLAGAIVMTQIYKRARSVYYLVVVSPVLTPGIIIGIATVVFWRQFATLTGMKFAYNGIFLTVMAQASFISAYCMLIILARLQRFDRTLEEAALDLGASYPQVFRHILLPFLAPALFSSAMLAFLSSFENYNATTFAILADKTLTTVIGGWLRSGTTPALSALTVLIVGTTLVGALAFEIYRRRTDPNRPKRTVHSKQVTRQAAVAPVAPSTLSQPLSNK